MELTTHEFDSDHLGATRTVWRSPPAERLCVFLDGDFYLEHVAGPAALEELLPAMSCALVSGGSGADRHRDYTCSDQYAQFLSEELLPWLGVKELTVLVGLSLSGLAAADVAFRFPRVFPRAICQSPSAWYGDESLTASIASRGEHLGRLWVSVGGDETDTDVRHEPTGLHQKVSQVDACRRLSEC